MIDKYKICSYREYLEKFLRKKFPNGKNQDIEDAVQETMIKAVRNQDTWQKNCSLKTWLSTIAVNMYFNTFRKSYEKQEETVASKDLFYIFDGQTKDFSSELCSNQYAEKLNSYLFLDTENDVYIDTFKMFIFQEIDYIEISKKQNIPIGTVKSRIFKARQKLQKKYEKFIEDNS